MQFSWMREPLDCYVLRQPRVLGCNLKNLAWRRARLMILLTPMVLLSGTRYRSFRMQRAKIALQQPVVVPVMILIASPTCLAIKKNGDRCSKPSKADGLCGIHLRHSISIQHMQIIPPPRAVQLCSAVKRDSQRCTKKAKPFSEYCGTHVKMFS